MNREIKFGDIYTKQIVPQQKNLEKMKRRITKSEIVKALWLLRKWLNRDLEITIKRIKEKLFDKLTK